MCGSVVISIKVNLWQTIYLYVTFFGFGLNNNCLELVSKSNLLGLKGKSFVINKKILRNCNEITGMI